MGYGYYAFLPDAPREPVMLFYYEQQLNVLKPFVIHYLGVYPAAASAGIFVINYTLHVCSKLWICLRKSRIGQAQHNVDRSAFWKDIAYQLFLLSEGRTPTV